MLSRFSCIELFETPWIVAFLSPMPMQFLREDYCSGLPCLPPGDLPDTGVETTSLMSPAQAGASATWEAPKVLVAQSRPTFCDPMDCPLSMGFSRQEYWSGLTFPPPDLPDPGIELVSRTLQGSPTLWADSLLSEPLGKPPSHLRKCNSETCLWC